eukprot:2905217-Pleurochrysis_carterae.AAC.1
MCGVGNCPDESRRTLLPCVHEWKKCIGRVPVSQTHPSPVAHLPIFSPRHSASLPPPSPPAPSRATRFSQTRRPPLPLPRSSSRTARPPTDIRGHSQH